jgi:hypothetical protein
MISPLIKERLNTIMQCEFMIKILALIAFVKNWYYFCKLVI